MFTGERILPGGKFHVTYQQSLFAYDFTRQRAAGKRVLDVGSGDGYGVDYLAKEAAYVVGLDVHEGAVAAARRKYQRDNTRFVVGEMENPPQELAGQKFDVVCSFQTIEHVENQDEFLKQLKQFAKPGGEVIVTTPNKGRFPGFNPYHVRELNSSELQELMQIHFASSHISGVFGDEAVLAYRNFKQRVSKRVLQLDVFRARWWLPRPLVLGLYGLGAGLVKTLSHYVEPEAAQQVTLSSFWVSDENLSEALDLLAVGTTHA